MARPRSASLPPDEMIALGEEMCQWVAENKPMHLCEWYCFEKDILDSDWDAMRKVPEFLHYYNKALKLVGMQYLTKDSPVEPSLKHRWQRVYFKDLKKQEDDDADDEIARKVKAMKDTAQSFSEEDKAKFDAIMAQLNSLQSDSKRSKKDSMS